MAADPERGVVVNLLESAGSTPPEQDTGDVGSDVIPYEYGTTVTHTFCWDDDDLEAAHVMTLHDGAGAEILRLQPNGACVAATIEPGAYSLHLLPRRPIRGGARRLHRTCRIATSRQSGQTSRLCCTRTSASAARSNSRTSPRQTWQHPNLTEAHLSGADLSSAILTGAQLDRATMVRAILAGADLREASMFHADLTDANLFRATLADAKVNYADLGGADLSSANLAGAQLVRARLQMANLEGAKGPGAEFEGADLTRAKLVGAELYGVGRPTHGQCGLRRTVRLGFRANIGGAEFTGAILAWTVWNDCRQCTPESVGECIHFPPPPPPDRG